MKKRLLSAIVVSVMALSLFSGCGAKKEGATGGAEAPEKAAIEQKSGNKKKFVIGYTNMADTDVFGMMRKEAFDKKIKTDPDMEVVYTDANGDVQKQLDQIDNYIAQKVDAIVIVPIDYEGIVPGVKKANEAGIPVLALGIQAADGEYTFVGSKNYDAGVMQGEFMAKSLPQNAQILYLEGIPGMYHSTERKQGIEDALLKKRPDIKLLASIAGNYDRAQGMKVTEDWIQTFPKFDAIIAANDQMALGAIEALKAANRLEGVMVSGIDGTKDACNAIKNGEMAQSIFQNAVGQADKAFEILTGLKKGEKAPKEAILPFESIDKTNVDKYLK